MRSPSASTTFWTRSGNFGHSPSTSQLSLISWQTARIRMPNSAGVSFQGVAGRVLASRSRTHETAISCNRTSCKFPGCRAHRGLQCLSQNEINEQAAVEKDMLTHSFPKCVQMGSRRSPSDPVGSRCIPCASRWIPPLPSPIVSRLDPVWIPFGSRGYFGIWPKPRARFRKSLQSDPIGSRSDPVATLVFGRRPVRVFAKH